LITGNFRTLGNFDECLRVNSNEHGFTGQACNVGVQFHIQPDNDTTRELDLADLFRNIAIASVSGENDRNGLNITDKITFDHRWKSLRARCARIIQEIVRDGFGTFRKKNIGALNLNVARVCRV